MSLNATASWTKSVTTTVVSYTVTFTQNSTALPPYSVPESTTLDSSVYSTDFVTATGITPAPNDSIGVSIVAVDADGLISTPVTAGPVVIPTPPTQPGPPQNVTLVTS